jgi:hypothetical protein
VSDLERGEKMGGLEMGVAEDRRPPDGTVFSRSGYPAGFCRRDSPLHMKLCAPTLRR